MRLPWSLDILRLRCHVASTSLNGLRKPSYAILDDSHGRFRFLVMRVKGRLLQMCPYCRNHLWNTKMLDHLRNRCPKRPKANSEHEALIVTKSDSTNCPNCGKKVLSSSLVDHLQAGCKHRGITKKDLPKGTHDSGCKICGGAKLPGEDCCYICIGD